MAVRFSAPIILGVASATLVACGLVSGLDSLEVNADASGIDASTDTDAVAPDVVVPSCDGGTCSLPEGWTPIAYHDGAGCPSGYTSQKFVTNPAPACACSCTVTSPPSCAVGSVPTFYGNNCGTTGITVAANNGNCVAIGSGTIQANFEGTPVAPFGGTCSPVPTSDASVTNVEACVPPCGDDSVCQGNVPTGFKACVLVEGTRACPSGFSTPVPQVGTSANVTCPACTCTSTGTCYSGKLQFFSDTACQTSVGDLTVDGACHSTGLLAGMSVQAAKYTAQANGACKADTTGSASASLVGAHTICCKP